MRRSSIIKAAFALEDDAVTISPETTIELKGPLAEVYSDALDAAYQKSENENVSLNLEAPVTAVLESMKVSLETAAIDTTTLGTVAAAINNAANTEDTTTVYAVKAEDVDNQTVVDVTKEIVTASESPDSNLAVVIDGTSGDADTLQENIQAVELAGALESIAVAHGVKVYHSLGEFLTKVRVR